LSDSLFYQSQDRDRGSRQGGLGGRSRCGFRAPPGGQNAVVDGMAGSDGGILQSSHRGFGWNPIGAGGERCGECPPGKHHREELDRVFRTADTAEGAHGFVSGRVSLSGGLGSLPAKRDPEVGGSSEAGGLHADSFGIKHECNE